MYSQNCIGWAVAKRDSTSDTRKYLVDESAVSFIQREGGQQEQDIKSAEGVGLQGIG